MYFCMNSISMKYFIILILLSLGISCSSTDKNNGTTYFGGQIVNPKERYVLLLKDDNVIDSITIGKNNIFQDQYKSLKEGLYTFRHGGEFQYVYIEPSDSILIRLNTWDFDESLVYSGKGSSKNEFLINLFLENEKEEKFIYNNFHLNENDFQHKIDSLLTVKTEMYNYFKSNEKDIPEGFTKLIDAAIYFPLYRLKEIYPYYYRKEHKLDHFPEVSDEFYKFREHINLNEESLLSFYPYQNYLVSYLYHISYSEKEKDNPQNNLTINVLNSVVNNIQSEEIKNTLLNRIVINDFFKGESTCKIKDEVLDIFLKNCTNQKYIDKVKNLVNDSKCITNKQPLKDFTVVSLSNHQTTNISDVIKNKNAVIYFWSSEFMSPDYLMNRIKFLEKNHPNILFIGINMKKTNEDNEAFINQIAVSKQFILSDDSYAQNYISSNYPRVIIVNKKGIVENGFTYLDSRNLSKEIEKLH